MLHVSEKSTGCDRNGSRKLSTQPLGCEYCRRTLGFPVCTRIDGCELNRDCCWGYMVDRVDLSILHDHPSLLPKLLHPRMGYCRHRTQVTYLNGFACLWSSSPCAVTSASAMANRVFALINTTRMNIAIAMPPSANPQLTLIASTYRGAPAVYK